MTVTMGEKIKARIEKSHCLLDSFLVRPKAGTGLGKNMPYFTRQPFHIIGMHICSCHNCGGYILDTFHCRSECFPSKPLQQMKETDEAAGRRSRADSTQLRGPERFFYDRCGSVVGGAG